MPVLPRFTSARGLVRPNIDQYLTVHLPGEIMQAVVVQVVDRDRVIVELDSTPMSRSHTYRKGDRPGARRRREHGIDIWEVVDDRYFISNMSPNEFRPAEEKPAPKKRRAKH